MFIGRTFFKFLLYTLREDFPGLHIEQKIDRHLFRILDLFPKTKAARLKVGFLQHLFKSPKNCLRTLRLAFHSWQALGFHYNNC